MRHIYSVFFIAVIVLMMAGCKQHDASADIRVKTEAGLVEGFRKDGIRVWLGVPFAQAPVGELRWREPLPVVPYDTVLEAKHFAADPMQKDVFGDMNFLGAGRSEDCLYLNIWAPESNKEEGPFPVLIYFNGGGWMAGSGSEPRYAGDSLAHHGVISITANYREGIFGFLSHPLLTERSAAHTSGNQGVLDQIAAIRWVHDNIAAFGGDPSRITIAGESAGSFSVSILMSSPLAIPMLAGCIGSSGAEFFPREAITLDEAEQRGIDEVARTGMSIDQLLTMPADQLQELMPAMIMKCAIVDGYALTATPDEVFARGEEAPVPLLAGWNLNEGSPLWALAGDYTMESYENNIAAPQFGADARRVMDAYGIVSDADVLGRGAVDLCSDLFTGFVTWKWCDMHRKNGLPVYRYKYLPDRPAMAIEGKEACLAGGVRDKDPEAEALPTVPAGACHSADIEYAMGNLATNTVYAWREEDYRLSSIFVDYYAQFCKTGNPNGEGLPEWPALDETAPVMQLDFDCRVERSEEIEARYRLLDLLFAAKRQ